MNFNSTMRALLAHGAASLLSQVDCTEGDCSLAIACLTSECELQAHFYFLTVRWRSFGAHDDVAVTAAGARRMAACCEENGRAKGYRQRALPLHV